MKSPSVGAVVTHRPTTAITWRIAICTLLILLCASSTFVNAQFNAAGTARQIDPSANTDFAQTTSPIDNAATEWASSLLDAYTLKPTFVSGGTATSVTAANFPNYWQTPFATQVSTPAATLPFSIYMASIGSGQYQFAANPFYPFGTSVKQFSYEAAGVFTYSTATGGSITFLSAGDMWVYIGMWDTVPKLALSLRGVHSVNTAAQGTIDLTAAALGLTNGNVQIRVYYACRSTAITPQIQITFLARPSTYCNALVASSPVANIYPFSGTAATPQVNAGPSDAISDINTLRLTSTALQGSATSVYAIGKQRLTSGFTTTFTYQITNAASAGAEGLTFIAQCGTDGLNARGGASGQLGYNGLPKGLVIEIDTYKDTVDSYTNQIGIFFSGSSGTLNYATPLATSTGYSVPSPSTLTLTGKHNIRIDYYPLLGTGGSNAGIVKVWLDNTLVAVSDIDASFTTMCNPAGLMYVGFTASTTSTVYADTYVSAWRFNTVPTAASASTAVGATGWQTQVASDSQSTARQLYIQAADVCGNAASGIGGGVVTAQLINIGTLGVISPATSTNDNNDGTYSIWFWYKYITATTATRLKLTLNGQEISGSPFALTITPAAASGATSSFAAQVAGADLTQFTAGASQNILVTLKDVYGNLLGATTGQTQLTASFASSSTVINAVTYTPAGPNYVYQFVLLSNIAGSTSFLVRLGSTDILGSPYATTVNPGVVSGANSLISSPGAGLTTPDAGATSTIWLTPRDVYGNYINTGTGQSPLFSVTPGTGVTYPIQGTWQPAVGATPGYYIFTYIPTIKGTYSISASLGGVSLSGLSQYQPYVSPATVNAAKSSVTFDAGQYFVADGTASGTIQARDIYGNLRDGTNDGTNFNVSLQVAALIPNVVTCGTGGVVTTQGSGSSLLTCNFDAAGRYLIAWKGQTAGNYTVSVTYGGTRVGGGGYWTYIDATDASAVTSQVIQPVGGVAGTTLSFTMITYDKYGNIRGLTPRTTDDSSLFDVVITTTPSSAVTLFPITKNGATYTQTWNATQATAYKVEVKLLGSYVVGGVGNTGTFTGIQVTPSVVSTGTTTLSGGGLSGGTESTTASIAIIARDRFGNQLQVAGTTNTIITCVTYSITATVVTPTVSLSVVGAGSLTGTYTVPTYTSGSTSYGVRCRITVDNAIIYQAPATVVQTGAVSYAVVISGIYVNRVGGTATSGVTQSFMIQNRDSGGICSTTAVTFNAIFTHETGAQAPVTFGSTADAGITSPCSVTGTQYLVQFALATAGRYNLTIRTGETVETNESKNQYGYVVVANGILSAAKSKISGIPITVTAGSTGNNFTATLYDAAGNAFTTNGGYTTAQVVATYGGTTAGINCSTTNTHDNGDGSFTISYKCNTIGTTQVTTTVAGSAALGGTTYAITVIPATPAAAKSTLATPAGILYYTAGQQARVTFNARDQYGNSVSGLTSGVYGAVTITLASNTDISNSFTYAKTSYSGAPLSEYYLYFTPTVANAYLSGVQSLTVSVAGVLIQSLDITIRPGDFDGTASSVSFPTTVPVRTYSAGIPFTVTLTARDSYGNYWYPTVDRVSVASSAGSVVLAAGVAGTSTFTVAVTVTAVGTAYSLQFSAVNILGSSLTAISSITNNLGFTIIAGVPVAAQTVLSDNSAVRLPGSTFAAGTSFDINIRLRDAYANTILIGGAGVRYGVVQTTQDSSTSPQQIACIGAAVDWSYNVTQQFFAAGSAVTDNGDGTYRIRMRGTKASSSSTGYALVIFVSAAPTVTLCSSMSMLFTITPLAADPASSLVDGTALIPSLAKVGSSLTIRVTMRDIYGNDVTTGGTVLVGVQPTQGTASTCVTNLLVLNTTAGSSEVFVAENGIARIQVASFVRSTAGGYNLLVTVNGYKVTAYECLVITLTAGYATNFATTVGTTYAAIPTSFNILATDVYGNSVVNGTHYYTASFIRADDTIYPISGYTVASTSVNRYPAFSYHTISYLLAWQGSYQLVVTLRDTDSANLVLGPGLAKLQTFTVMAATCAADTPTKPFRCPAPSFLCVGQASDCSGYDTTCSAVGTTRCNTTTCSQTSSSCACPAGMTQCIGGGGHCVVNAAECPAAWNEGVCASGYVKCTTGAGAGECRSSIDECPSSVVCSSGYVACPDKRTCSASLATCPSLGSTTCPASAPYLCRSGVCALNGESCGTGVSCGANQYLCADGTCTTTPNLCSQQYLCYAPTATRCPDGSCRSSLADCPSTIVCPINWVRCPNNNCATSLSSCSATESCNWNSTLVRCPDGSCQTNLLFCGTSVTCNTATPVMCGDRSCVTDGSLCLRPPQCSDSTAPYQCPDGSCSASLATCPTTITCPATSPVLCPDLTCVTSVASCTQLIPACPATLPIKCVADGSCRARAVDCPTATQCADSTPVRCPDGNCAIAIDACVSIALLICPVGSVRCPSGECSPSLNLCPTHVTCITGTIRCSDGTCRSSCATVLTDYLYTCGVGRVICPQATQGTVCADSLEQCPSALVCPPRQPVRCADQTCAATVDECQAVTAFSASRKACPGGFWAAKDQSCGTPVTCPKNLPTKCWDETCRVLPADCPPTPQCPSTSPFVCPNGECQDNLYSCSAGAKCTDDSKQVKCFAYSSAQTKGCVANRDMCLNTTDAGLASLITSKCPDTSKRCRNGACAPDVFQCAAMTCPPSLPVLCIDGLCAKTATECNIAANGCPFDRPTKCLYDGSCVALATSCPTATSAIVCAGRTGTPILCSDGSCASSIDSCPALATGCPATYIKCIDGTCISSSGTPCIGTDDSVNTCPLSRPYRCADGFCAISSYLCPIMPHYLTARNTSDSSVQPLATYTCGVSPTGVLLPVRCADGTCRTSYGACPIVRACTASQTRCGNGQCIATSTDTSCPSYNSCPTQRPYKCANGLCAISAVQCIDDTVGCPANQVKCTNGQCAAAGTCGTPALGSGCATGQFKCNNGACVSAISSCPASNGCLLSAPFLCSDGTCSATRCTTTSFTCPVAQPVRCASGLCATSADACTLANGCNVQTPYRCADGTCKKYQAVDPTLVTLSSSESCQSIITCPSNLPYLCANNECVTDSKYCRPLHQCTTGTLCRDGICRDVCDATTQARCPAAAPTLCPSGACKKTIAECESQTSQLSSRNPCTSPAVLCADGTCASGWLACGAKTFVSLNPTGTWSDSARHDGNATCTTSTYGDICADGSCVPHRSLCPPVPACPTAYPWRCSDGSCMNNGTAGTTTCPTLATCASGTQRCSDGYCRVTCLAVHGCPLSAPFYCAGKKAPCVASYSACAAVIDTLSINRRLLNLVSKLDPAEACADSCMKNVPAIQQSVVVPYNEEITLDIAVDTTGISRTSMVIPSGALGATQALTISPVGTSSLDRAPFYFAQKVLSTPWTCSRDTVGRFALNATVSSSIDTRLYNLATGSTSGSTTILNAPCELQSNYLGSRSVPNVCSGVVSIGALLIESICNADSTFQGTIQTVTTYNSWDLTSSYSCLCYNITSGNAYPLHSLACYGISRVGDIVTASVFVGTPSMCPTKSQIGNSTTTQVTSLQRYVGVDACGGQAVTTVQLIPAQDICLGTIDPISNTWRCLEGRNERIAYPTWDTNSGRPRSRVMGRISSCDYQVYAFVHIALPDAPAPPSEPFDWWKKWRAVILGVGISVVVCGFVSAFAISRLIRYRRKYREKKKQLDQLTERAQDLDEYAGGLGIADEEVDMVANPLVVEMQELEKQVKAINDDMAKEGEENQQIDELERERQRIFAEIEKIKDQLAKDRDAAAAARVSIDKGPVNLNAGTGGTTTGGTQPARTARVEQPKRHDFGDAKRPARKKNEE